MTKIIISYKMLINVLLLKSIKVVVITVPTLIFKTEIICSKKKKEMLIGFPFRKHVFACLSDVLNSDNVDKFCRQNKIGMKLKLIIELFHRRTTRYIIWKLRNCVCTVCTNSKK